ncbi:MAG: methylenetetrahydrofolate reductase [NAD(P)H] [Bryobacterales bacterium]|nr:methylenetetrahydrofolate reductase [NAD(P)H] [Bryobacterales bacterium]
MRIGSLYGSGKPVFSFEFFPPKTEAAAEDLLHTVGDLQTALAPDFISVTYGAGGSTRSRTLDCVTRIQSELGICSMAHLACMGHSKEEIAEIVSHLVDKGVRNILALRGDPPRDAATLNHTHFRYAIDLIGFLASGFDIDIGAACYPETHPEAINADDDLRHAVEKTRLGAKFLITQLFFDNAHYYRFLDRAHRAGITVPIVPGIMPITNVSQVERFTKLCGASIPGPLAARLNRYREDHGAVMACGIEHAITQCRELLDRGVPGLHFYTLNKSHATRGILAALRTL